MMVTMARSTVVVAVLGGYGRLGLSVAGMLLRWWSIRVLGRFFTVDVATGGDQHIVRTGPYRWLRHPSYTGALTSFFGLGLCQGDFVSLGLIFFPVLAVFLHRIRIEERALAQGDSKGEGEGAL